jgi:hypothetical protein
VWDQVLCDGGFERDAERLMEVEDGFGGERPAFVAAIEGEAPLQRGQVLVAELAELEPTEVGDQILLD